MCMFVPTTFFFDPCMQLYLLNIDTLLLYYEQRGYLDVQQRSVGYADVSASLKKNKTWLNLKILYRNTDLRFHGSHAWLSRMWNRTE